MWFTIIILKEVRITNKDLKKKKRKWIFLLSFASRLIFSLFLLPSSFLFFLLSFCSLSSALEVTFSLSFTPSFPFYLIPLSFPYPSFYFLLSLSVLYPFSFIIVLPFSSHFLLFLFPFSLYTFFHLPPFFSFPFSTQRNRKKILFQFLNYVCPALN